jgi:hypothetical protein
MGATLHLICASEKEKYFSWEGLTRFLKISTSGKSVSRKSPLVRLVAIELAVRAGRQHGNATRVVRKEGPDGEGISLATKNPSEASADDSEFMGSRPKSLRMRKLIFRNYSLNIL